MIKKISLASQLYFSLLPVGGARERKIRLDTLGSFPWTSALMCEVQIWLVYSKLSTQLPAYQSVYYSLTMAFYDTDFALGFMLHRCMTRTSRVQKQHQDVLLLNSQVTESRGCGHSSRRWNYRPHPLSRRLFFQRVVAGSFWMSCHNSLPCGHKLHKTVTPSRINALICIPCTWPAAVERNYYIPSWHRKLASVQTNFSLPLAFLTGNKKKYGWLARL